MRPTPIADTSVSNIQKGVLFPYTRSTALYRCPSDKSTAKNQRRGHPRTRHYSMSCYTNGQDPSSALVDAWVFPTASLIGNSKLSPSEAFIFIHETAKPYLNEGLAP